MFLFQANMTFRQTNANIINQPIFNFFAERFMTTLYRGKEEIQCLAFFKIHWTINRKCNNYHFAKNVSFFFFGGVTLS